MLATELYTRDIPDLYQRFDKEIDAKHWRSSVELCNAAIRGNELLSAHLQRENEIAFQLNHLDKVVSRYGAKVPINDLENPAIYPAVSFSAQVLSLIDVFPRQEAEKLKRRVNGAFRNPDDMRGLRLELSTATHFIQSGKKVSWPETNGDRNL